MGKEIVLKLNYNFYLHVMEYLRELLPLLNETYKIEDLAQSIRILEVAAETFFAEENFSMQQNMKFEELFLDKEPKDFELFQDIARILDDLTLTGDQLFCTTVQLYDLFNNEVEK